MALLASQRAAAEVPALVHRTLANIEVNLAMLANLVPELGEVEGLKLQVFVDESRAALEKMK